jgi:ABC-type polysaccharide/polyol phosphate transport system ATPase subunit
VTTRAIELAGVGKRFTKYVDTPMLLTSALRLRPHTRREKLWAVRNVDFAVDRGESVGVIGRNGSGKTTMMSVMAGITAPTEGSVRVWGRVAPLIGVGVGFHRELTGRENIFVNGSILGLSRRQISERLDEIVDFAEIESFIDTPVKFYSSGMFVRLGFAVAVHVDPQVLLVDEVLAVGDIAFQVKCYQRMEHIRANGATIVMVSHNLGAVQKMCERVLLLHDGAPVLTGSPDEAIGRFHELLSLTSEVERNRDGSSFEPGVVVIEGLDLVGPTGEKMQHVTAGSPVTVQARVRALQDLPDLRMTFVLFSPDGAPVYADTSEGQPLGPVRAGEVAVCRAAFRAQLPTGSYSVTASMHRPNLGATLAQSRPCAFFVNGRNTVYGVADLEATFSREPSPDEVLSAIRSEI